MADVAMPAPGLSSATAAPATTLAVTANDLVQPDTIRPRERFIPVTSYALIDRLTSTQAWAPGQARKARRFFRYLEYWRRQQHSVALSTLLQSYESFSPDSDLLITRTFTAEERATMQKRVVREIEAILKQANYVRIDPTDVEMILTEESHYGLDLQVDFTAFEEILIYYRGASNRRDQRRSLRKFMRREEFDVPIFQRLFLLFKLKPFETRVLEIMKDQRLPRREAEKIVKNLRSMIPAVVDENNIYLKLFKNIPRSDVEMVFPNTRVKFRLLDKLRLGITGSAGLGMGAFGAAGKIAVAATNPLMAAGAVLGLGGVAFRQAVNFLNQKQRYMVVMAQNLYFHAMADNRGVLIKLADRAAEEDVKEEMLLYSVLAKETAKHSDLPAIDAAIEQYLQASFGISVDFDLEDALQRLLKDGIVTEEPDGTLRTLSPEAAARHLDAQWDIFLDNLPDPEGEEGQEGQEMERILPKSEDMPPSAPMSDLLS
ncbi:TMEM143 family protein [Hyphomicrobium sp.]|uniref:TMEM143 family protein n=1 Tax=Hyphomicrobium sp. TaxID=82 RepID=UPI002E2ECEDA|nr:TMEM143 family protein [Hyphomicrobium sp.]HEX2840113.1 TMEM143 family protein [Hyphomicrobium sp.]